MPSKKTYGLQPKRRSAEEIQTEYHLNAFECGHKQRMIWQLQLEVEAHLSKLCLLSEETPAASDSDKDQKNEIQS